MNKNANHTIEYSRIYVESLSLSSIAFISHRMIRGACARKPKGRESQRKCSQTRSQKKPKASKGMFET